MRDSLKSFMAPRVSALVLLQNPSGSWSFQGAVPSELAYQQADGSPITQDQIFAIKHAGPGFAVGVKSVSFRSKEDALDAAKKIDAHVSNQ